MRHTIGDIAEPDRITLEPSPSGRFTALNVTGVGGLVLDADELIDLAAAATVEAVRTRRLDDEALNVSRLSDACDAQVPVLFLYRDAEGQTSARVVSPHRVTRTSGGFWSLECWDHGRQDYRHFRVERLVERPMFLAAAHQDDIDAAPQLLQYRPAD